MIAMSFLLHGFLFSFFALPNWVLFTILFIRGAFPDLAGIAGGSAWGNWRTYKIFHMTAEDIDYNKWYWNIYKVIVYDHLYLDKLWHDENGQWYDWGYYLEGMIWGLLIFLTLISFI